MFMMLQREVRATDAGLWAPDTCNDET